MLKEWIKKLLNHFKNKNVKNDDTTNLEKIEYNKEVIDITPSTISIEAQIKNDKSLMINAKEANRKTINRILSKEVNDETLNVITSINQYILQGKSFQWLVYISNNSAVDYTYICQYYECLGYKIIKQTRTITIEWSVVD